MKTIALISFALFFSACAPAVAPLEFRIVNTLDVPASVTTSYFNGDLAGEGVGFPISGELLAPGEELLVADGEMEVGTSLWLSVQAALDTEDEVSGNYLKLTHGNPFYFLLDRDDDGEVFVSYINPAK